MFKENSQFRIYICDDSVSNVLILKELLKSEGYEEILTFTNPEKLLLEVEKNDFDLLLLDIEMPKMSGIEVLKKIRKKHQFVHTPILIITGRQDNETRNQALDEGASDFVRKPIDQTEVVLRVKNLLNMQSALKLQTQQADSLEKKVQERTRELSMATDMLINRLAMAGELRDNETGQHVERVGQYARILAEGIKLPAEVAFLIEKAAPLHDLGKIGIPDNILLKKGKLTDEEIIKMREHTTIGEKLLADHESPVVQMASVIASSHHEKWDGSGYPKKIKGESIPIEGRITAICDVFDALITERPYKKAWTIEEAVEEIKLQAGKQFDPKLVEVFLENLDSIIEVRTKLAE